MSLSNVIMDLWDKYDLGTVETCRTLKVNKHNVENVYMKGAVNFIARESGDYVYQIRES